VLEPGKGDLARRVEQAIARIDVSLKVRSKVSQGAERDVRVVLLCVGQRVSNKEGEEEDAGFLATFRSFVASNICVLPLLMPGYRVKAGHRWWPESMPELGRLQHGKLFVDLRKAPTMVCNNPGAHTFPSYCC